MCEISDEELAARWQAGDERAYEELYSRHWGTTVTRAYAVLRYGEDAEDVAQEVWAKYCIRPATWDGKQGKFKPWIERCSTNKAIERWRSRGRRRTDPADDLEALAGTDPSDIAEDVAAALDRDAMRLIIRRCLQLLGVMPRQVLIYEYYEELSVREISQRLGSLECREVPVGTVNSRLNRAREQLRQCVMHSGLQARGGKSDDE